MKNYTRMAFYALFAIIWTMYVFSWSPNYELAVK